jgi:hypothetical protein
LLELRRRYSYYFTNTVHELIQKFNLDCNNREQITMLNIISLFRNSLRGLNFAGDSDKGAMSSPVSPKDEKKTAKEKKQITFEGLPPFPFISSSSCHSFAKYVFSLTQTQNTSRSRPSSSTGPTATTPKTGRGSRASSPQSSWSTTRRYRGSHFRRCPRPRSSR